MNWRKVVMAGLAVGMASSMTLGVCAAEFDPAYYAAQNPDVVAVVGSDESMLRLHYDMFGKAEGRAANAESAASAVGLESFDAEYYAAQNPDVVAIYGTDALSLYTHYVTFGAAEGRAPSAAAAEAAKSGSDSSDSNPYARFASSGGGSSHHSHSSSKKSGGSSSDSSADNKTETPSDKPTEPDDQTVEHDADSHELTYTSNDDGTHSATCSVTNCTYTATTEDCDETGEDGACSKCGYKETASQG